MKHYVLNVTLEQHAIIAECAILFLKENERLMKSKKSNKTAFSSSFCTWMISTGLGIFPGMSCLPDSPVWSNRQSEKLNP